MKSGTRVQVVMEVAQHEQQMLTKGDVATVMTVDSDRGRALVTIDRTGWSIGVPVAAIEPISGFGAWFRGSVGEQKARD